MLRYFLPEIVPCTRSQGLCLCIYTCNQQIKRSNCDNCDKCVKDKSRKFCPELAREIMRALQAETLLCLVIWWGIATGESVPKGPKPLRYGPEVVGESFAPKD